MQFVDKSTQLTFEIPDEWWESGRVSFTGNVSNYAYPTDANTQLVSMDELAAPLRDGGLIWFRNRDSVVNLLQGMCEGAILPPIPVWSKGTKHPTKFVVRDGFHRYYLSLAMGFTEIPIRIDDFDLDAFFAAEK